MKLVLHTVKLNTEYNHNSQGVPGGFNISREIIIANNYPTTGLKHNLKVVSLTFHSNLLLSLEHFLLSMDV